MTAAVAVFSCQEPAKDPVALGTPVPVVDQASLSETSFTVTWEAVENAVSYAYTLNNGTEETAGSRPSHSQTSQPVRSILSR